MQFYFRGYHSFKLKEILVYFLFHSLYFWVDYDMCSCYLWNDNWNDKITDKSTTDTLV